MAGRTTQHCYQNDRLYGQMRFAPLSAARQRIIICYNQHGMHVWILQSPFLLVQFCDMFG